MTEFAEARKVAELLAAIAEPTRLLVLWQLAKGPNYVGALANSIKIDGKPLKMVNMSHHLGVMRQAGVLENDKEGRQVLYRLRPDVFTPGTTADVLGVLTLGQFRIVLRAKPEAPPVPPSAKSKRKPGKK